MSTAVTPDAIIAQVEKYWGYDSLRPLQSEAIDAGLSRRDSLVVLPTGGGKSLCYQVPPLIADRTDVVVSPLISLMKDQVDGLQASGYPAAALHSGMTADERREVERGLSQGAYRLVFAAPERLVTDWFVNWIDRSGVRSFAVDEAHCISHWGHDFRPEYRQLAVLREKISDISLHAFTATATPRVREDIIAQLNLIDPVVLVGNFDRANLTYRILPLLDVQQQALEVIRRHENEAAIVYCISRKDTESMAGFLKSNGVRAAHYHAGMDSDERRKTQELFTQEELDVVVATVAFGMGIDRSNVRCVIHAAMPKSIEHYQQETGRAGRDGLEAECVLFYTAADFIRWKSLLERSAQDVDAPADSVDAQIELLSQMSRFCSAPICRHKTLTQYFGQDYEHADCGACDVCLGEIETLEDAPVIAQKILSCIARTDQRFGIGHIVSVLMGSKSEQVIRLGHDQLSTYGLLSNMSKKELTSYVYQLIDQELISRTPGDRPTLYLNEASVAVMRGESKDVKLIKPKVRERTRQRIEDQGWEGVDRQLFEILRKWRQGEAQQRGVPPYVICGDRTLRDLARTRPTTLPDLRAVHGLGDKRISDFGQIVLDQILAYCDQNGIDTNVGA